MIQKTLQSLGHPDAVKVMLRAVIAGPRRATFRDFSEQLGRLSLHFWRPDFTPEQSKLIFGDFAADMRDVTAAELRDACQAWRLDPLNRFFPTTGQLLELVKDRLADRARERAGAERLLELMDGGADSDAPSRAAPRDFAAVSAMLARRGQAG